MQYWFLRSPYKHHSWASVVFSGEYLLFGVRSKTSLKAIKQMAVGDIVVFYSSANEKKIFGLMEVVSESFQDPSSDKQCYQAIKLKPIRSFLKPLLLSTLKDELKEHLIFRQPRICVVRLELEIFNFILSRAER